MQASNGPVTCDHKRHPKPYVHLWLPIHWYVETLAVFLLGALLCGHIHESVKVDQVHDSKQGLLPSFLSRMQQLGRWGARDLHAASTWPRRMRAICVMDPLNGQTPPNSMLYPRTAISRMRCPVSFGRLLYVHACALCRLLPKLHVHSSDAIGGQKKMNPIVIRVET
jgi:hypothetical protein